MPKPTPQFWHFAGSLALVGLYMLWVSYTLEKLSKPGAPLTFAQYVKKSATHVRDCWNPPTIMESTTRSPHRFGGHSVKGDEVFATCRECGDTFRARDLSSLMGLCLGHVAFPKVDMQ